MRSLISAGALGDLDELERAEQAALRVLPADEPLGGDRAAEPELDLRLVVEHELVAASARRRSAASTRRSGLW